MLEFVLGDMMCYMCPDCGERVDDTVTVRGVFGEDEVCPHCGVNERKENK